MFKKISFVFLTIISITISQLCVYADTTGVTRTHFNAYPTKLYYNGNELDDAVIYQNTTYVPMRALAEEMNYTVTYEPYNSEYYSPLNVEGDFTITNGIDTVKIYSHGTRKDVYKNDENITKKTNIHLINRTFVDDRINYAKERDVYEAREGDRRYITEDTDINNYLKKDTTYISVRSISELFGCKVDFDKATGNVYIYGDATFEMSNNGDLIAHTENGDVTVKNVGNNVSIKSIKRTPNNITEITVSDNTVIKADTKTGKLVS